MKETSFFGLIYDRLKAGCFKFWASGFGCKVSGFASCHVFDSMFQVLGFGCKVSGFALCYVFGGMPVSVERDRVLLPLAISLEWHGLVHVCSINSSHASHVTAQFLACRESIANRLLPETRDSHHFRVLMIRRPCNSRHRSNTMEVPESQQGQEGATSVQCLLDRS
jgi:hypothetical protein